MNWFSAAAALLMAGGAAQAFYTGNWKVGVVFASYAVANAMLSLVKG